ncbi:MAG: formate dehydrogenase accessory sulfurtransferase FdhD [Thermoanaerobaculia bacterium]|nr:formate dehydrogenase accessory sulfurtransferase FdhD [Thermoanaerobaculia bacterium]
MREDTSPPLREFSIHHVRQGVEPEPRVDSVTVEEPLEIRVGRETLTVTMRTPGHDFELAAGFLCAEGLAREPGDIVRMEHCRDTVSPEEEGNVLLVHMREPVALDRARRLHWTSSSCGLCGKGSIEAVMRRFPPVASAARMDPAVLAGLPDRLKPEQTTFELTGGLHGAGVFDARGEPLAIREDVGRHNAVDKVIGRLLLDGRLPLSDAILLVSGRASFEIVQKAVAAGIPAVVAVSAPSSLAVDLARQSRVLLAGFTRGGAFNLYSGEDRVAPRAAAR